MRDIEIQLEEFLQPEYMQTLLALYGFKQVNQYPKLSEELAKYARILQKLDRRKGSFKIGETFTRRIKIDEGNYYNVVWSITKAKRMIKRLHSPVEQFSLKELYDFVDHKSINRQHLNFALHNHAPVILASYPSLVGSQKLVLIDGNHRVTSKYEDGQQEIEGLILLPYEHMSVMLNERYRLLYKIHANCFAMASYIGEVINESELQSAFFKLYS